MRERERERESLRQKGKNLSKWIVCVCLITKVCFVKHCGVNIIPAVVSYCGNRVNVKLEFNNEFNFLLQFYVILRDYL